jgi:hypothetical protein
LKKGPLPVVVVYGCYNFQQLTLIGSGGGNYDIQNFWRL